MQHWCVWRKKKSKKRKENSFHKKWKQSSSDILSLLLKYLLCLLPYFVLVIGKICLDFFIAHVTAVYWVTWLTCVLLSDETMYTSTSLNRILKVFSKYKYKYIAIYLLQRGKASEKYGLFGVSMNYQYSMHFVSFDSREPAQLHSSIIDVQLYPSWKIMDIVGLFLWFTQENHGIVTSSGLWTDKLSPHSWIVLLCQIEVIWHFHHQASSSWSFRWLGWSKLELQHQ